MTGGSLAPVATNDERSFALAVIQDTVRAHGFAVIDADELAQLRTDLATALAALRVVASPGASDEERARALALADELDAQHDLLGGQDAPPLPDPRG